jgi:hypothetical protein
MVTKFLWAVRKPKARHAAAHPSRDRTRPSTDTPAGEKSRRSVRIERRIKCSRRRRGTLGEIHGKKDARRGCFEAKARTTTGHGLAVRCTRSWSEKQQRGTPPHENRYTAATQKPAREEHGNEDPIYSGGANGMKTHTESGGARLTEMKTERTTGSNGARFEKKTVAGGVLHRELRRSRRVFGTWPWRRILGETRLTLAHN